MRSLWQSITCIKNPFSPFNLDWVCWRGWDLFKEVLWVSVGQLAANLQAVKVGGWSYCTGNEPRPHSWGSRWAGWLIFFQTTNFESLQLWCQLIYRVPQYLFGKISTSLTNSISIKRTKRIFNTSYALSKWAHLHRIYVIGGCISFWLAVYIFVFNPAFKILFIIIFYLGRFGIKNAKVCLVEHFDWFQNYTLDHCRTLDFIFYLKRVLLEATLYQIS